MKQPKQKSETYGAVYGRAVAMLLDRGMVTGRATVSYPIAATVQRADGHGAALLRQYLRAGIVVLGIGDLARVGSGEPPTGSYPHAAQDVMAALALAEDAEPDAEQLRTVGDGPDGWLAAVAATLGPGVDLDRITTRPAISYRLPPWEYATLDGEVALGRAANRSRALAGLADLGAVTLAWSGMRHDGATALAAAVIALGRRMTARTDRAAGLLDREIAAWGAYLLGGGDPRLISAIICAARLPDR